MYILSIGQSYSDNQFLFPKEKPSIFKKIDKDLSSSSSENLPQKKPLINQEQEKKKEIITQKKIKAKEEKEVKKVESIEKKKTYLFFHKKNLVFIKLLLRQQKNLKF